MTGIYCAPAVATGVRGNPNTLPDPNDIQQWMWDDVGEA
jgi:hypothetical protein